MTTPRREMIKSRVHAGIARVKCEMRNRAWIARALFEKERITIPSCHGLLSIADVASTMQAIAYQWARGVQSFDWAAQKAAGCVTNVAGCTRSSRSPSRPQT
jgi:hypothetical protein